MKKHHISLYTLYINRYIHTYSVHIYIYTYITYIRGYNGNTHQQERGIHRIIMDNLLISLVLTGSTVRMNFHQTSLSSFAGYPKLIGHDFSEPLGINPQLGEWRWLPSGYVKIAIENDHRNSGFSHELCKRLPEGILNSPSFNGAARCGYDIIKTPVNPVPGSDHVVMCGDKPPIRWLMNVDDIAIFYYVNFIFTCISI